MTDLQCPARAVLLAIDAVTPSWMDRLRIAARFELSADEDVAAFVDATADEFRGEDFVVVAATASLAEALGLHGIRHEPPVAIGVDADGWSILVP
ncbi:hypothetical protein E8P82_06455 [Arthrobacter echini]|uniref:Uncharacterized protein n=1 Tax=Arthrobacter echini TaxID=1529066 RepID=A0A4S5E681_9MICC|nr:hypothetical protein [Arthrobacter echini]THJ67075.1 hypothetical protein E8P82_06455 [Arthrobacter echini]